MTVARWLPPAVREAPEGEPRLLDAVLAAVDTQRELLEADVERLWEDLFVESCADWAVPYIGALLGLPADAERREVAYAIALRRRKGTPAALEDFAEVVTGLTARVVEGWQVVAWAQRLAHPGPPRPAAIVLGDLSTTRVGTPFERTARSLTPGARWHPRAATVVVWPWRVRTYVATQALALAEDRRYALHPLGPDAPLYLRPRPLRLASEDAPADARTGDETDAPVRATYDVLRALGEVGYGGNLTLGPEHPLAPQPGVPTPPLLALTVGTTAVPWSALRFGSLPDGAAPAPPAAGEVVVDVARGRVELGPDHPADAVLRATWHRPVGGDLGALACEADADLRARVVVTVDPTPPDPTDPTVFPTVTQAAVAAEALCATLAPDASRPGVPDVEIRLATSDRLAEGTVAFTPRLPRWRIVAPPGVTPVLENLALDLVGACVSLSGCYVAGRLRLGPGLRGVELDGLTFGPGAVLEADPEAWGLELSARRCLLGPVRVGLAAFPVHLADCVVDGAGDRLSACGPVTAGAAEDAVAPPAGARFGPALHATGVTFAGAVRAESVDAADCVFADGVEVVQQQEGCIRHSYLGPPVAAPRHPATYRCGPFPPPTFVSTGFEAAGYYALALEPDHPLLSAAGDGGEVGAYHATRRAARLRRLRQRVEEFVPLGLRAHVALAPWEE